MTKCYEDTAVVGCHTDPVSGDPVSVVIHYTYDHEGAPAVRITDSAGVPVAAADGTNTTPGSCPIPITVSSPDVEWEQVCDQQADGSTVSFLRRSITSFDETGSVIDPVQVDDFELDKVTPYTVTGTEVACPACDPLDAGERGLQASW